MYFTFVSTVSVEFMMDRILLGILMVLGGSFEFWRQYNKEIVERESDDIELPPLIKQFKNLSENKKERPICLPYSLKARFFIHAHLSRFALDSSNLRNGNTIYFSKQFKSVQRYPKLCLHGILSFNEFYPLNLENFLHYPHLHSCLS